MNARVHPTTGGESTTQSEPRATDCPECGATASVRSEMCDVCYAELDEFRFHPMDASWEFVEPGP